MPLQVYHPTLGKGCIPSERRQFELLARRAERHRPSPQDIQLNLFTDASPATRAADGGVGLCYGDWLPGTASRNQGIKSMCFVIRGVRDSNECELVAIADAILVVCELVKQNLPVLEANNWKVKVTIRSDSLSALLFLRKPGDYFHPSKRRWHTVLNMVERVTSEVQSLAVDVSVTYSWIQALSVRKHIIADSLSKCTSVKNGTAPKSRAMSIMYPDPIRGPIALSQHTPVPSSSSIGDGPAASHDKRVKPSEGAGIGTIPAEMEQAERSSKLDAPIDNTDNVRPRKKARYEEDATRDHAAAAINVTDEELISSAINHIIQHSRWPRSLDIIRQRVDQLQGHQRCIMLEAIEAQIQANQKPLKVIPFFPNTLYIIENAVRKLPIQMRNAMQSAVEAQHEENCSWGADQAIYDARNNYLPKRPSM